MKNLLLITLALFSVALSSAAPVLKTVTAAGLHYGFTDKGGEIIAELPAALPVGAYAVSWDLETLTLSYLLPPAEEEGAPIAGSITYTQAQLDASLAARLLPKPQPVPERVTRRQLYLALFAADIDLDAAVAGIQDPTARRAAEINVQTALYFPRDHTLVNALGTALGLTTEQIDDIYRAAAKISDSE